MEVDNFKGNYFEFAPNKYEGCYYNCGGHPVGIIAAVGIEGAWAAYMGGAPDESEEEVLAHVASYGVHLSEKDARHYFPNIDMPYRA